MKKKQLQIGRCLTSILFLITFTVKITGQGHTGDTTLSIREWSKTGNTLYLAKPYNKLGLLTNNPYSDFQIGPEWTVYDGD